LANKCSNSLHKIYICIIYIKYIYISIYIYVSIHIYICIYSYLYVNNIFDS
jgi:hypothetical protein